MRAASETMITLKNVHIFPNAFLQRLMFWYIEYMILCGFVTKCRLFLHDGDIRRALLH